MGKKIKNLGLIIAVVCPIVCIIWGATTISDAWKQPDLFEEIVRTSGWITIFGGSVISIIAGVLIMGFGELIENSAIIAKNNAGNYSSDGEKNAKMLKSWKDDGLITEEEYQEKLKNL